MWWDQRGTQLLFLTYGPRPQEEGVQELAVGLQPVPPPFNILSIPWINTQEALEAGSNRYIRCQEQDPNISINWRDGLNLKRK